MDYIFGHVQRNNVTVENLKTIGDKHSNLSGFVQVIKEYPDAIVTDVFYVVEHYQSDVDEEGKIYDWYVIDKHYRTIDKTPLLKESNALVLELAADHEERLCLMELGI